MKKNIHKFSVGTRFLATPKPISRYNAILEMEVLDVAEKHIKLKNVIANNVSWWAKDDLEVIEVLFDVDKEMENLLASINK
jgi:hypothetical protein